MPPLTPDTIFWTACCVQLLGLSLLVAARSGQRWPEGRWLQGAFFLAMALLGGVAMVAFEVGSGCWASCGATLAIMAVGVTVDLPTPASTDVLG